MKRDIETPPPIQAPELPHDSSGEIRRFAAWMGLIMVAFGVVMAGYLFYRIGLVVLDPRSFETQVNRWEFVVRGRTTDALPQEFETPRRQTISPQEALNPSRNESPNVQKQMDHAEETAYFLGRIGSKSARPAAIFIILLILMLMVRIITAVIHAGIRLAGLAGGEREYLRRIITELVYQRDRRDK